MRTLTIKRQKSFVGCLAKMKVYVTDPEGQLQIDGESCRLLGTLANGREERFQIPEDAVKIYVIADAISKDFCRDYCEIPAGQEDVELTGKNRFDPGLGNAFLFDRVSSQQVLEGRVKAKSKGYMVLIGAVIVGVLIGGVVGKLVVEGMRTEQTVREKTFTDDGMSITLTEEFEESQVEGFTLCYESDRVVLLGLKEEFTMLPGFGQMTAQEYARLVMDNNGIEGELMTDEQVLYCVRSYESPENGTFIHILAFYKTENAFWMLQFMTPEAMAETYKPQILSWCKTVTFGD